MRLPVSRTVLLIVAAIMLLSLIAIRVMGVWGTEPNTSPAAAGVATATIVPQAADAKPAGVSKAPASPSPATVGQAKPTAAAQAKPTTASQAKPTTAVLAPGQPAGQAPAQSKPSDPADAERARIVRDAVWSPGQLQDHFEKHGSEGPWASESVYDASARETVMVGTQFTYVDRTTNAERLGFFDKGGNRFTSVTRDGRRITTHFRPDRGEAYVRSLFRSTYR